MPTKFLGMPVRDVASLVVTVFQQVLVAYHRPYDTVIAVLALVLIVAALVEPRL